MPPSTVWPMIVGALGRVLEIHKKNMEQRVFNISCISQCQNPVTCWELWVEVHTEPVLTSAQSAKHHLQLRDHQPPAHEEMHEINPASGLICLALPVNSAMPSNPHRHDSTLSQWCVLPKPCPACLRCRYCRGKQITFHCLTCGTTKNKTLGVSLLPLCSVVSPRTHLPTHTWRT